MKLIPKTHPDSADTNGVTEKLQAGPLTVAVEMAQCFRRLKSSEVVVRGDFVANDHLQLEPWDGPGGFRAGAFLKPIYRRRSRRSFAPKS